MSRFDFLPLSPWWRRAYFVFVGLAIGYWIWLFGLIYTNNLETRAETYLQQANQSALNQLVYMLHRVRR